MQNPVTFLDQRLEKCADPVQAVMLGPKRFILIFDPEIATTVLVQKSDIYIQNRGVFDRIKPVTGERGLVQLEGDLSREFRKRSRPIFSPQNLQRFKLIIEEYIHETLDGLRPGVPIDMMKLMTEFTIRSAFRMFLGIDIKKSEYPFGENFLELNRLCGKRMLSPFGLPGFRIQKLKKSLRSEIKKLIKGENSELNVISTFKDEDSLIDQCLTFLFAGHETTAASLAFTFLILSKHPEYQKRINREEDLALKAYKESLRLYTPAYMLAREAAGEDQLGPLRVQKGDQILIGMKQIHRLKKYFQEPDEFLPERFHASSPAFFPFGKGPKSCIGEALAYLEADTVIKAFCRRFTLEGKGHGIVPKPFITLHPEKDILYVS